MKITQSYKYKKNGIIYFGSRLPEDAELIESLEIVYADNGHELIHKYSENMLVLHCG